MYEMHGTWGRSLADEAGGSSYGRTKLFEGQCHRAFLPSPRMMLRCPIQMVLQA